MFLCVIVASSAFVNVSRSTILLPDPGNASYIVNLCSFFYYEWMKDRQLTPRKKTNRKDKFHSICWSKFMLDISFIFTKCALSLCRFMLLCFALSIIRMLLVRGGIEVNPGPLQLDGTNFSLISQNCIGLTDRTKLANIIRKLYHSKSKCPISGSNSANIKIACLQETHKVDRYALTCLFKGEAVIDDGERNQRGVCILVPEEFELCGSQLSGRGRWAIATIKDKHSVNAKKLVIVNVYAPNCHREAFGFFQDIVLCIDELTGGIESNGESYELIITGDLNMVMDGVSGASNRAQTRAEGEVVSILKEALSDRDMAEPSGLTHHTWRRGTCSSKLDYIFVSRSMLHRIKKVETKWHVFGANFDHAAVSIHVISAPNTPRGRSFPKVFKSDIANEIDKGWLLEQLIQSESQMLPHWTPHMKLDFIKTMLRSKTLELRQMRKSEKDIERLRNEINSLANATPISTETADKIDSLKLRLHDLEEATSEELRIKSGVKWREEGEKSTAFFLARFKARSEGAIMHSIRLGNRVIEGSKSILEIVQQFYKQLYNKPKPSKIDEVDYCNSFFEHCPMLDPEQRRIMACPLTIGEIKASLATCKDSAPGLDGIPYSFYSAYPDILLKYVKESWQYALTTGELASSHKRSCITLLPKKGKDLTLVSNWRPIASSACDLKIITKAYADRLKLVLPSILCEAQAAYTPGRDISFNNRLVQIAKNYAIKNQEDFCAISLDAQKAFDSVDHRYIAKVLEVYGFPPEFIEVFSTLYSNLESVVQVNGFLSKEFGLSNGVKQGDALSCGLFVLAIDPLLRNLLSNTQIEGLHIPISNNEVIEIKTIAYADDVTVVCRNAVLQPIFSEYERFSLISGLVLNADKTEVFNFIRSPQNRSRISYLEKDYVLDRKEEIKMCGIWIARDEVREYKRNVLERIELMEAIIMGWGRRNLSLNGRMILAKTFLLSQIVFPAQVIKIQKKEIKKIEKLIYAFVNGAKNLYGPERIARLTLKAPKEQGGINGIDVESFVKSIMAKQFAKAAENHVTLSKLQSLELDGISQTARLSFRQNYRSFAQEYAMPDLQQLGLISGIPVNLFTTTGTTAARFVTLEDIASLWDLQSVFHNRRHNRSRISTILKALPRPVANLVRAGSLIQHPIKLVWFRQSGITEHKQISAKTIRKDLFNARYPNLRVRLDKIHKRADWPPLARLMIGSSTDYGKLKTRS